jgi:spermidine synthase
MSSRFEELAWQATQLGEISLRRRFDPSLGFDIFEVKLGDEFLMSSLFTVAEEELARLGLAVTPKRDLAVLVGGLGLGYTAVAALEDDRVRSLTVVDAVDAVIDWHRRELLPVSKRLIGDPRTTLQHGDFFAIMRSDPNTATPFGGYDAILVDIDHSPRHLLNSAHSDFYTADGLRRVRRHLADGGVFALWSDDPPDAEFGSLLTEVFTTSAAHVVAFPNALTGGESSNTVYVAR